MEAFSLALVYILFVVSVGFILAYVIIHLVVSDEEVMAPKWLISIFLVITVVLAGIGIGRLHDTSEKAATYELIQEPVYRKVQ